jgi:recombination protein RecT
MSEIKKPEIKKPDPNQASKEVRATLHQMTDQFKAVLPPQVTPERFLRVVLTAVNSNQGLLECPRKSLLEAAMKAAQDGLLPDGKEAALIPFGNRVQYLPMVAGILKKVRNSGELQSLSAHIVYQADSFEYWIDETGEKLMHKPAFEGDRGQVTRAYAIAHTKEGGRYIELMTIAEIEQVRKSSKAGNGGPWKDWWGEMAKKTVIKRLSKRLPMSTDLEEILKADNEMYEVERFEREAEKPSSPQQRPASRLKGIIQAQAERIEVSEDDIKNVEEIQMETDPDPKELEI